MDRSGQTYRSPTELQMPLKLPYITHKLNNSDVKDENYYCFYENTENALRTHTIKYISRARKKCM
jgi:hypothetical protein